MCISHLNFSPRVDNIKSTLPRSNVCFINQLFGYVVLCKWRFLWLRMGTAWISPILFGTQYAFSSQRSRIGITALYSRGGEAINNRKLHCSLSKCYQQIKLRLFCRDPCKDDSHSPILNLLLPPLYCSQDKTTLFIRHQLPLQVQSPDCIHTTYNPGALTLVP